MGVVEVWREPSEFWRWRYTEPPSRGSEALELLSNEVYESRQEAVQAASTAYPGIPVLELDRPPGAPPVPSGAGRARLRRRMPERRPRTRGARHFGSPPPRRVEARHRYMTGALAVLGITLALLALRLRRHRRTAGSG